jgi:hypothetical protein
VGADFVLKPGAEGLAQWPSNVARCACPRCDCRAPLLWWRDRHRRPDRQGTKRWPTRAPAELGEHTRQQEEWHSSCVGLLTVRWWKHLQVTAFDSGDGVLVVDGDSGKVLQQGDVEGEVRAKGIR